MADASSGPEYCPLRVLRWPDVPAVDLLSEFSWVITGHCRSQDTSCAVGPARDVEDPTKDRSEARTGTLQAMIHEGHSMGQSASKTTPASHSAAKLSRSPYKQILVPATALLPPRSPAQRAGKKMPQIKMELEQIGTPAARSTSSNGPQASDLQGDVSPTRVRREAALLQSISPTKSKFNATPASSSPKSITEKVEKSKQSARSSPTRKTRTRACFPVRTPAELDLIEKQKRLMGWLQENLSRECAKDDRQNSVSYSLEVAACVRTAVTCKDDVDGRNDALWVDPIRSLLAAEVTSESVLGGFVPTRRLAFQPSASASPEPPTAKALGVTCAQATETSPVAQTISVDSSLIDSSSSPSPSQSPSIDLAAERSHEIQTQARLQLDTGRIQDALATLDTGIHQLMYELQDNHEELRHAGFNYSVLAHQLATKLQLHYRHRYRGRVRRAMVIQRAWRRFRLKARSRSTGNYNDAHAATIQRLYKRRYRRIVCVRSAARIQKCFRVYQSQKHILHFHQACRLLLAREHHRRELAQQVLLRKKRMWIKLKIVLHVLRLWSMRRGSITCLQKRWKGGRCRARYAAMLNEVRGVEIERRGREDAYVADRIDVAVAAYRSFLTNTRRGRELVKLHGELPWIRFQRLRSRGEWMRLPVGEWIDLLDRMYNGRRVGAWEWWVMAQELSLVGDEDARYQHARPVQISSAGLQFLHDTGIADGASAGTLPVDAPEMYSPPQVNTYPTMIFRFLSMKLARLKALVVDRVRCGRRNLSKAAVHVGWRAIYYPRAYYWHHRFLARRAQSRTRGRLEDDFKRVASTFLQQQFRGASGNRPRVECATCNEPFATTAELVAHSSGATLSGTACVEAKQRSEAEWRAVASDSTVLRQRRQQQSTSQKRILHRVWTGKQLSRSKTVVMNELDAVPPFPFRDERIGGESHSRWNFCSLNLALPSARYIHKQGGEGAVQQLITVALAIVGLGTAAESVNGGIPLELVGYVFQALGGFDLDEEESSIEDYEKLPRMLMRTALYQYVTWNVRGELPGAVSSSTLLDPNRSPSPESKSISTPALRSLFEVYRPTSHRVGITSAINLAKSMLDQCRQSFQSVARRLRGRQTAYHQSDSHSHFANDSTTKPASTVPSSVTVPKRAEHRTMHGSAIATAPSTVVPIT